jgi:SPP1 gp7 family putative phage head morphogenesis protein
LSLAADEKANAAYFERIEKKYEKDIAKIYRDALAEIRKEMSQVYEKYSTKGVLTKAEMTRYNRLVALEKRINDIMNPANKAAIKVIDRLKPEEYGEAYFRAAWAIDNATGVALDWGALDKKALIENLDNPFYTSATETILRTQEPQFRNAINRGLTLGQSYPDMMKDMRKAVNGKNFEVMRILRTELHAAQEAGTSAGYAEARDQGVEGVDVWVATLDNRTRDSHAAMDGVERDADGYFHGEITAEYPGDPGLDAAERINCRCSIRFQIDGMSPALRRSKEDGVIPYQTYRDWSENKTMFE